MAADDKKKIMTPEDIIKLLDQCYDKCLNGIPKVSPNIEDMANDYLKMNKTKDDACKSMIVHQIAKCSVSGFLTGFGGVITLPVAIPANIGSVIYFQMRMIACIAYIAGYELKCDQTKALVYACLAGVSVNQAAKAVGVKAGVKVANTMIKKIPANVIAQINKKVGFRLLTKFGSKGVVKLGKLVPGVGAVIGSTLDYKETKALAKIAYRWFMKGDFSSAGKNGEIIDIEPN